MAQDLVLRDEVCDDLVGYATTPISFLVDRMLRVEVPASEVEPVQLDEVPCIPHWKDYDKEGGNAPTDWPSRFDTSNWRVFSAWSGKKRLGGIVVVHDSPGIDMLEGRDDVAVLWDVRVHPDARGGGVGRALVRRVEDWAGAKACRELKVETQNVNVPACRFYQSCGFELRHAEAGAYPELPDEVMLLWYKRI